MTVPPLAGDSGETSGDYLNPMILQSTNHNTADEKDLFVGFLPNLNGEGAPTVIAAGQTGDVELPQAIDALFNHPNVGPYLARELIHNLVTSNPSPAYVERVAGFFNDNGSGVRGSLWAMVKGVLLDPEARNVPTDVDLRQAQGAGPLRARHPARLQRDVRQPQHHLRRLALDLRQLHARPGPGDLQAVHGVQLLPAGLLRAAGRGGPVRPRVRHHGREHVPEARQRHEHARLLEHRGQLQRDVVLHAQRDVDRHDGAPAARADAGQPRGQAEPAAAARNDVRRNAGLHRNRGQCRHAARPTR